MSKKRQNTNIISFNSKRIRNNIKIIEPGSEEIIEIEDDHIEDYKKKAEDNEEENSEEEFRGNEEDHNISETEICNICNDRKRDSEVVCVVEDIRDVMAIENTSQFKGMYHVLGGIISPMDGIGPEQLRVKELLNRLSGDEVHEIILATNPTIEGDATALYLAKLLKPIGSCRRDA